MLRKKKAQKKRHCKVLKRLIAKYSKTSKIAIRNVELEQRLKKVESDSEKLSEKVARQSVRISGLKLELGFRDPADDQDSSSADDSCKVLGKGTYGTVIMVSERGMLFALKKPHEGSCIEAHKEELRMLQLCRERGVTKIVPFFEYHGKHGFGIGMLKLERTLADEIREGRVDYGRFLSIAMQMWGIVASLHKARIMHCDLKSDNVLLHGKTLFACDLGLASEIDKNGNSVSGDTFFPDAHSHLPPAAAIKEQIIGVGVDFWGIIIILLEIIFGHQVPTQNYNENRPNYADLLMKGKFSPAWQPPEHLGQALETLVKFVDTQLKKSTPCKHPCFKEALQKILAACNLDAK